jgi:hypothetical protein
MGAGNKHAALVNSHVFIIMDGIQKPDAALKKIDFEVNIFGHAKAPIAQLILYVASWELRTLAGPSLLSFFLYLAIHRTQQVGAFTIFIIQQDDKGPIKYCFAIVMFKFTAQCD